MSSLATPDLHMVPAPDHVLEDVQGADELLVQLARKDPNTFMEYVLRDEKTGQPIAQAPLHETWQGLVSQHDRLLIWSHIESGKAVSLDTEIPTPRGWLKMGDLSVGTPVFGRNGQPCYVTWCSPVQIGRRVFEVQFDDGCVVRADAEHRWLAQPIDARRNVWRVVTTLDMAAKVHRVSGARRKDGTRYQQSKWRMPLSEPVQYPERVLPVHPYVLGAWLGDGDSHATTLTFHEQDRLIYDLCVGYEGGAFDAVAEHHRGSVVRARIGSYISKTKNHAPDRLRLRLRKLGVLNNKHIPLDYLTASIEQRRELLAGLLDTDGTVNKRHGNTSQIEFSSCLAQLAVDVLELARSLGFKARMRVCDSKLYGRVMGKRYRVFFTAREPVFKLPRKLAGQGCAYLGNGARARYRYVTDIREVESIPVRCIAVDSPDNTYLMGRGYIVTHNTSQLSVGRTLWELGNDPTLRIAIVSNTHEQAGKVVRAVAKYIEQSEELRAVFPKLAKSEPWTGSQLTVARPVVSKDPSIQAFGVHGNVLGARIDRLILDDMLDFENTRTPGLRQELWDWYHATLVGRLTAHAKILVVGTAYHPDDFLHRLVRQGGWQSFRYPILDPVTGESRWPDRWPLPRIEAKRQELGPLEFTRQMLCQARDDAEARFKQEWIDVALRNGAGKDMALELESVPPGCRVYTGVDLAVQRHSAADRTVFFTILVRPDKSREVLWVDSGKLSGPQIVQKIVETHQRFHSIVIVENNAAQDFILQFTRGSFAVPVRPFTTGRNKANPEFGVESLAAEMAGGKWIIPNKDGRLHPEVSEWIIEMLYYDPTAHTGDRLMASWFAREGARQGGKKIESGYIDLTSR